MQRLAIINQSSYNVHYVCLTRFQFTFSQIKLLYSSCHDGVWLCIVVTRTDNCLSGQRTFNEGGNGHYLLSRRERICGTHRLRAFSYYYFYFYYINSHYTSGSKSLSIICKYNVYGKFTYDMYLPYLPYPTLQFSRGVGKREKANGLCNPLMILFRWIFS